MNKKIERIGEKRLNNQGLEMEIIKYDDALNIEVKFKEDGFIKKTNYGNFKNGKVSNPNYENVNTIYKIGETNYNNQGCLMKIVERLNRNSIIVEFQDKYKYRTKCQINAFINGQVRNNFFPSLYGVGFIGNTTSMYNGKLKKSYEVWCSMINRCYNEKTLNRQPTYKDCYVCKEWHCYATFEKWFNENYYEIENEKVALDKDILIKGNKIYSCNTCCFVPIRINSLFIKNDADRGKCPIGVYYEKSTNKFVANCNTINQKNVRIGRYDTQEEAFEAYKEFKENYIKEVANEYEDKIPKKLYDAMYNWIVEIDD